jgi:hypothetical protein
MILVKARIICPKFLYSKFVIVLIFECLKRIKQQLLLIIFVIPCSNMKSRSIIFYLTIICDIKSFL